MTDIAHSGPSESLQVLAKSVLLSSTLPELDHPSPGNYSYGIVFQGPVFECQESNYTAFVDFFNDNDTRAAAEYVFGKSDAHGRQQLKVPWQTTISSYRPGLWNGRFQVEYAGALPTSSTLNATCPQSYYAHQADDPTGRFSLIQPRRRTECIAAMAEYEMNVTTINGVERIDYRTGGPQALIAYETMDEDIRRMQSWGQYVTILALVDSLIRNFQLNFTQNMQIYLGDPGTPKLQRLPNGTEIETCSLNWSSASVDSSSCEYIRPYV
jgi:hypothetical protein